jgi:lipoprotein signal peptidase
VLHWATFNVADVAITLGMVLLGWDLFASRPAPRASSAPVLDGGSS